MVQSAGFDPAFPAAAFVTDQRQGETAPDARRVTPAAEADPRRGEDARADAAEKRAREAREAKGRVAFTAKFGPDEDGFPLRVVRGEDLIAAEQVDVEKIQAERLARANRQVLLDAQEDRESGAPRESAQAPAAAAADRAATTETRFAGDDGAAARNAPEERPDPPAPDADRRNRREIDLSV